jgi:hypothetical protein
VDDQDQPCTDCQKDPIGTLKQLFVDRLQVKRINLGQTPALRPVFSKTQGVAHGWFEPLPDLDESLRVGVFAMEKNFEAWVRFSSDCQPGDADQKNTLGIAIKLFGVPGEKLFEQGDTQDFLMQNHDVFLVPDAESMCEFTREILNGAGEDAYDKKHPETGRISKEMEKTELSALSAIFWSAVPYRFGKGRFVKYKLAPRLKLQGPPPADHDYLSADLARRLKKDVAVFDFYVQFQKDQKKQPLDHATTRWEESDTPPVLVARLTLPVQDVTAPGQANYGQNLAFQPWHSLPEHEPIGSISDARRVAYEASAKVRRMANGTPMDEPGEPRREPPMESAPDFIAYAAIYPPIGIARVGNSNYEFFLAPETPYPEPHPPGFYRDAKGALKRQAARFRVYGMNEAGVAVRELTADIADIKWTVRVANKKAAWYQFQLALDIPEAASAAPSLLRNISVSDRKSLKIEPRSQTVSGINTQGGKFDDGCFMGQPVYLGEVSTDCKGRLVVLGGHGAAKSITGERATTFANNDGWYDDISDGPVTAEVKYQGRALTVVSAWVVVAPPNYAPLRKSVRTMWDVMRDVAINSKALARPVRPSFSQEIRPIFERLNGLQWVNKGFSASFGWNGPNDLAEPAMLHRLSSASPVELELRRTILNQFRSFDRDSISPVPWPWQWGDAMNIPPLSPRAFHVLSGTQLGFLQQWAIGDFDPDYDPREPVRTLDAVPIAQQPDILTRAAMEFCVADAFHPGSEMTWPMRKYSMYASPFRIALAHDGSVEPDFGPQLTLAAFSSSSGPLAAQWPGGLTRWLGVPWQTDAASCDSGYDQYDPYLPTFWPARVPNQVLTTENYRMVMNGSLKPEIRMAAFAQRADWLRPLGSSYPDAINNMVRMFGAMGVIEQRPGPGDPAFPRLMEVESDPIPEHADATANQPKTKPLLPAPPHESRPYHDSEKAHRFPYGLK